MATWSQTQQLKYFGGFIFGLLLLIGLPVYLVTREDPTCFDGEQNGVEEGVDCGGVCEAVCSFETQPANVLWARSFEVVPGVYNSVALIENPNVGAESFDVPYSLKLRDADNLLLVERNGRTYIPPQSVVPVFEASITTGETFPSRTTFTFLEEPEWQDAPDRENPFTITGRQVDATDTDTRFRATLTNTTFDRIEDVHVVAIAFGRDGNARAVSQTLVDRIDGKGATQLIFTWPGVFDDEIVRTEIYPIVVPE